MSEVENILIEDDVIIIITSDGLKRTLPINNQNEIHKAWISNIISMAESLVYESTEDALDSADFDNPWADDYGDVDDFDDDWL